MCSRNCPISVLFSSSDIIMSMSREQPLCREDSEELSRALAAGEWWAIVEVEIPISELPEFGNFTWCGPLEVEEAEAPVPTRTPLGSPVPKSQDWRNRHLSETVKPERQHPQEGPAAVESPQHAPVPTWFSPGSTVLKSQDWRNRHVSETLKPERQHPQEGPAAVESPQHAPVPTWFSPGSTVLKSQDWRNRHVSEPQPERQHPQQSKWMQKRVQKAPAAESSQQAHVPTGSPPKPPLPLAPKISKGALVNSGTSQGSLVPSVSPKLGESLRIPKQPWQKQREENIPKGASGNVGVCQPAPKNKICVDIVKKDRKPRKTDRIKTSHQHQISIPPRSQMNRKRALDNADVDRSLTSTQNAPLGNQSQGPGPGTSQRQEIVQFMHHIHTFL
ncbi:hypothetical protein F2P79_006417 [Pimephales promelas]|nr:hypothetical protein F2P79_006417 [Pimephales promelas]